MPKAIEIKSTRDRVGRRVYVGTKVAFTLYNDSELYVGTVKRITAGIINNQVYVTYERTYTDWRGTVRTLKRVIRRPAKNVVRTVDGITRGY